MESNRDEAIRCIRLAEAAVASGDKQRALKFIRIARRLDPNIPVEELLATCEERNGADSASAPEGTIRNHVPRDPSASKPSEPSNGDCNYTEEQVKLIGEIRRQKDYYKILGVEKSCSVEEVRKAYRKLSLKVHPDKNKAPGSEEAFKTVCKAFKCLSDEESRRQYDRNGFTEDHDLNQHYNNVRKRRRRATRNEFFDDDFNPDEVFRSFFFGSQGDVFRSRHAYNTPYRTREMPRQRRETGSHEGEFRFSNLLHFVPFLIMFLILYLPFSEPEYTLQKNYTFQIPKVTAKHGVEYYVKTANFDHKFPQGSPARANLEYNVLRDYKSMLARYCHVELQRRQWARNYPTPHCDKLRIFGVA